MKQRILSALCLLPLPVLALYFGSPWFEIFASVVLAVMGWEWEKMVLNRFSPAGMALAVIGVVCVFLLDLEPALAWIIPAIATAAMFFVAVKQQTAHQKLFAFGVAYSIYPVLALVYLRQDYGFMATLWVLGTVWAMDTGAYFFGKAIGGPKMAPKISPKKRGRDCSAVCSPRRFGDWRSPVSRIWTLWLKSRWFPPFLAACRKWAIWRNPPSSVI